MARTAERQKGMIATRQLVALGFDCKAIARRAESGRLHRVYRGVYAVGHAAITQGGRFMAAVLACGDRALLSIFAGGAHWEFVRWDERLPDVTVVGPGGYAVEGIRVHRARRMDPQDVWRHDGIPITSPARTLLDLAVLLPERALRRAVRHAQALRRVDVGRLRDVAARYDGHRGVGRLLAVVADGRAPTRSELEDVVLELLDRGGVERPEVNPALRLDGAKVVPDFLWRERRVIVEADGAAWHDHKLAREHDADRQALLEAHGFRVVRVTWEQAVRRPSQTLSRIQAALGRSRP